MFISGDKLLIDVKPNSCNPTDHNGNMATIEAHYPRAGVVRLTIHTVVFKDEPVITIDYPGCVFLANSKDFLHV